MRRLERERERERERARASQAGFMLSTEPNSGLDPTILGSCPEPKSRVGCSTELPRHP